VSLSVPAPAFHHEVPYGSMERPVDGREWPGQRWALVSGDGYSFALASDAIYSYAADEASLYLTVLRSPVYACHDPYQLVPGREYAYTDQGEHAFTLRLLASPVVGPRDAQPLADDLLRPPVVTPHVSHGGTGPHRASLLPLESASSVVTWLKGAESKDVEEGRR